MNSKFQTLESARLIAYRCRSSTETKLLLLLLLLLLFFCFFCIPLVVKIPRVKNNYYYYYYLLEIAGNRRTCMTLQTVN